MLSRDCLSRQLVRTSLATRRPPLTRCTHSPRVPQSWRIDDGDFVCTRVEPHAEEEHNRELFRRFFIDGKLHTSFQVSR